MSEKLITALKKRIKDESLVPKDTLATLIALNGVSGAGKLSREELMAYTEGLLDELDYTRYLPQYRVLTNSFVEDVLDPVMTARVPAGVYRVTMRKLLKLSLAQLQEQAALMKLDVLDLDEEGVAAQILINMNTETPLILPLSRMLLSKEIAYVFGIRMEIPLRGPRFPSSATTFVLRPTDMEQDLELTRDDLLEECINQGISVTRKESQRQLAVRLVVWWSEHPGQVRQPFTPNFAEFIMETAKRQR